MFSVDTLVQLVAVFAAVATPSLGAVVERDGCYFSSHLYLGVIDGEERYVSSPRNYLGSEIFMPVDKVDAATFRWEDCTTRGGSDLEIYVSIIFLK